MPAKWWCSIEARPGFSKIPDAFRHLHQRVDGSRDELADGVHEQSHRIVFEELVKKDDERVSVSSMSAKPAHRTAGVDPFPRTQ